MNEFIKEVAEYIIKMHTIKEAAEHFGKSESSIKKYLSIVRDNTKEGYDAILHQKLDLAQQKIILMGVKKGGTLGKRKSTISLEEAKDLGEDYIKNGLSLRELEAKTGIPKSTLHENIHKVSDTEFQDKLDSYTKGL